MMESRENGNDDPSGNYANLDELARPSPVENPQEQSEYRHYSLEETRSQENGPRDHIQDEGLPNKEAAGGPPHTPSTHMLEQGTGKDKDQDAQRRQQREASRLVTKFYTTSYLVFFSLLGTLARVGLVALNKYPDTPVVFTTIWANFGGSLILGFLAQDRKLFLYEWGTPTYHRKIVAARQKASGGHVNERNGRLSPSDSGSPMGEELMAAKKAHLATKKTIPLYIGLSIGFCGSFTSFSTFIRDVLLAITDDLHVPDAATGTRQSRDGGYSFLAMLAVIITTVSLSLSALFAGAHLAIALEKVTPSLPHPITRRFIDPVVSFLAWGCWLGAAFLAIFPPYGSWRGKIVFSLVFAPLGCLARFHLALFLNGKRASFPLGTFAANMIGTAVLGMSYDIQRADIGGVIGCQVLQGIEDGFCGCLTTISTWVAELSSLRRGHAYVYGAVSVVVATLLMILEMGGLRWTRGFEPISCSI